MLKSNKLFIFLLVSSIIWGAYLQIIYISGIGSVYILRIILLLYAMIKTICIIRNPIIDRKNFVSVSGMRLGIFWLWLLMLYFFGQKTSTTTSSFITYTMNLLLIICVAEVLNDEYKRMFALKVVVFNALILALLGIFENRLGVWFFSSSIPTKWDVNIFGTLTPVTIFHNQNNFCMFMVFALVALIYCYKGLIIRILGVAFTFYYSLLTSCRTGTLAIVIIIALLFSIKYLDNIKKKFIIYFLVAVFGIIYVCMGDITLTNDRLAIWKNTFYAALSNKFIGVGPGNMAAYLKNIALNIVVLSAKGGSVIAPHNYALELLLETGFIGTLILGGFFIKLLFRIWCLRSNEKGKYYFIMLFLICLTSICVSTMTDFFQYWLFVGLSVSFVHDQEAEYNGSLG